MVNVCRPEIQVRVGRLEHLGLIKSFRAKLQNNPELKQRFDADHRKYAELRWSLYVWFTRTRAHARAYIYIYIYIYIYMQ